MAETVSDNQTTSQTEASALPAGALRMPWRDAAKEVHAHLKIGRAIKNQRIRDQWELDHARAEKAEWIRRTTELLARIFANEATVEQYTQYAATVLPEYAEFDLFVDQFEDEMRHRLGLLQGVLTQLDTLPEALPSAPAPAQQAGPAAPDEPQADHEVEVEVREPVTVMQENDMSAVATEATITTVLDEASRSVAIPPPATPNASNSRRVEQAGLLILATTDDSARREASEFLHDLGFRIDVIDRAASPGKSVVELLAQEKSASFAVVVADASAIKEAAGEWQFELGFCAGRLGAPRVCVVSATNEMMQDRHGIRHLALDGNGGWQLQMARHLKRAGVPVDLNRLC